MLEQLSGGERLIADWTFAPHALGVLIDAWDLSIDPDFNVPNHARRQPFSGEMPCGAQTERRVEVLPVHVLRLSFTIGVIATQVV